MLSPMFVVALVLSVEATPLPGGFVGMPSDDGRYLARTVSTDSGGVDCSALFDTQTRERIDFCDLNIIGPTRNISFDGERIAVGNVIADPAGNIIRAFEAARDVREPVVETRISGDGEVALVRFGTDVSVSGRQVFFDRLAVSRLGSNEVIDIVDERDSVGGSFGVVDGLISQDGNLIAFETRVGLVSEDQNGLSDIYAFDLDAKSYTLVTGRFDNGLAPSQGRSWLNGLSADGRYVLFGTTSELLFPSFTGSSHLYRFDLASGLLELVFLESNSENVSGVMSRNGDKILLASAGLVADAPNVILAELGTSGEYRTSRLLAGRDGISVGDLRFSPDGRFAAFAARPGPSSTAELFVFDTTSGTSRKIDDILSSPSGFDSAVSANAIDYLGFCNTSGSQTLCRADLNQIFSSALGITLNLEEPAAGSVYSGIGNLRGWAVGRPDITIRAAIDGIDIGPIPYGGGRGDVGSAFPDDPNAEVSGFSQAFNYNLLGPGVHTITVEAQDQAGLIVAESRTFSTIDFGQEFLGRETNINFSDVVVSQTEERQIELSGLLIGGQTFNVKLRWDTPSQQFEIQDVRPN